MENKVVFFQHFAYNVMFVLVCISLKYSFWWWNTDVDLIKPILLLTVGWSFTIIAECFLVPKISKQTIV
jgi:hypothetical protein